MKKTYWLAGLFAFQLFIAAGIYVMSLNDQRVHDSQPLVVIKQEGIDKLVIIDPGKQAVVEKINGRWVLPSLNNLSASGDKLATVLDDLTRLKTTFPITSTAASFKQLSVNDDNFIKKIQLYSQGKITGELLLGTSPGFKKTHVRVSGDNHTYALDISSYDFPAESKGWLDKSLLAVSNLTSIKGNDFEVQKADDAWHFPLTLEVTDTSTAPAINQDKIKSLSDALAVLKITDIAESPPEFSGTSTYSLRVAADSIWHYRFLEKDNTCFVKRDDIDLTFKVTVKACQNIMSTDKQSLIKVVDAKGNVPKSEVGLKKRHAQLEKNG